MSGILFGSISTVADTSELQRQAFNEAFEQHELDWRWERDEYRELLAGNGGARRITEYAAARGQSVDAAAVHATKSELFQRRLASSSISPREGVVDTIQHAKRNDLRIALVTTTSPENIAALIGALAPAIEPGDFDLVVDSSQVQQPKPDKAAYCYALENLGESANGCVAIEDNVGGVRAAVAAGLSCVAFPNTNTAGQRFDDARGVVHRLDFEELRAFTTSA